MNKRRISIFLAAARCCSSLKPNVQAMVICGPSGVGKGSIINELVRKLPNQFAHSVSHTTRKPRKNEVDGVHYHFVSKETFQHDIDHNPEKYLEYAFVHDNIYGTSYESIHKINSQGKICLFDIDTHGVRQFKKAKFPARFVFVLPPRVAELEERLRLRGTDSEEQIRLRLKNSIEEMKFGVSENFDLLLINDSLDEAVDTLLQNSKQWFPANLTP